VIVGWIDFRERERNNLAASVRCQGDFGKDRSGWLNGCHTDDTITFAPTGPVPLIFETEGSVDLESVRELPQARLGNRFDVITAVQ
jgi:hypothetical protein